VVYKFEKIPLIADKVHKALHIVICFFDQNKESLGVVDIGSHKLENEHNVISLIEVSLLVFLNNLHYLFLLLVFYNQILNVHFLCNHNFLFGLLFLHALLLSVDVLFLYLYILVVEIYILVYIYF